MARSPVIAYDARDFLSLTQAFRRYLSTSSRFTEVWTSFNPEDPSTAYLELMAYLGDVLFVYQEWVWNQLYTSSMTTQRAAIDNAAIVGKEMRSASPATLTETLTFDLVQLPVTLPARYLVSNGKSGDSAIYFEYDSDSVLTVTAGLLSVSNGLDLSFIEGRTYSESFDVSDGTQGQHFTLSRTSYIDATLKVYVNGVLWEEIASFSQATVSSEIYLVTVDEQGLVTVTFGDGRFGKIPTLGQTLDATYRVGGGKRGRVAAGIITKKVTTTAGVLSVTNALEADGGEDAETVEEARISIPAFVIRNDRFVTDTDHSSGLNEVAGVSSSLMLRHPTVPAKGVVYVIPSGGGSTLSGSLITAVRDSLRSSAMLGVRFEVRAPLYLRAVVEVRARAASHVRRQKVEDTITEALEAILDFDTAGFTFGTQILLEDIYAAARDAEDLVPFSRFQVEELRIQPDLKALVTNTGRLDLEEVVITVNEEKERPWLWELHAIDSTSFKLKRVLVCRASDVSESVVTDGGAAFSDVDSEGALVEPEVLRPRLDDPFTTYAITTVAGTMVTATVPAGDSLQDSIDEGQQFGVVFTDDVEVSLGDSGTAGVGSSTALTDTSKTWTVNEWVGAILKDSLGAALTVVSNTATVLTVVGTPASGAYTLNEYTDSLSQVTFVVKKGTALPVLGDVWWFVTTGWSSDVIVPDYTVPKVDLTTDLTVTVYGGIS